MKIERVDEQTVQCFLSLEELEEHNLSIGDFFQRSDRAKELVHEIMEQASQEVGYKPPRFVFEMQIMAVPGQGVVLTFSEKENVTPAQAEAFRKMVENVTPAQKEMFHKIMDLLGNAKANVEKEIKEALLAGAEGRKEEQTGEQAAAQEPEATAPSGKKKTGEKTAYVAGAAVFAFEKLQDVMALASALPEDLSIHSDLYVMDERYYLCVFAGGEDTSDIGHVALNALDYGVMTGASESETAYIREHGECLVAERALNLLKG